jgi:hypothetical protein
MAEENNQPNGQVGPDETPSAAQPTVSVAPDPYANIDTVPDGSQPTEGGNRVLDSARTVGDAIENAKRLDPNTLNPAELVAYQQAISIESDIAALKKNGVDEAELLNMPISSTAGLATREIEIDSLRKDVEVEKAKDAEEKSLPQQGAQTNDAAVNAPKGAEESSRESEEARSREDAERVAREAKEAKEREEAAAKAKEAEEEMRRMGAALLAMSGVAAVGNVPGINLAVAGIGGKLMGMGIDPKSCEHRGGESLCSAEMHHGVAARGPARQQQVGVA